MLFGRAFEQSIAALFRREDPAAALFEQWSPRKAMGLAYSGNDTWDRMLQQGVQLLERFAQDGRVRIQRPRSTQQIQFNRTLGSNNNFVSYVDAIGELDGTSCVLEWKTTSARYPVDPVGISALDPQLVCYSWMTGIEEVAQVVFVRKRLVEVQYLRAAISDEQRQEFATLVEDTVKLIRCHAITNSCLTHSNKSSSKTCAKKRLSMIRPKDYRVQLDLVSYENLRQQILRRDGWRCQFCGSMSNLEVHHQRFRSQAGADSEQNLITLCTPCHAKAHLG